MNEKMERPGEVEFTTREVAMQFAKARVEENWIVHCYCPKGEKWVVSWWCQ
jgi:hypothetical protein